MPTAYSYIRFSTPDQILGDSLRRQLDASTKYAAAHNLTLDDSLNMRDLGISAFKGSNVESGALGQFLIAIDEGRVANDSYLLVESLDRISRLPVPEALAVFQSIINRGITIVTLIDSAIYSKERMKDDWTPLLIALISMSRAHEESAVKSRRVKAAWEVKKARVIEKKEVFSGRCPWWLKPSDDKSRYEIHEEKANVVRLIFQLAKDGLGNALIAKYLNEREIPPAQHAKFWQNSTVGFNLRNIAAIGVLQLDQDNNGRTTTNTFVEDYYPPIIDKDLFYEVQTLKTTRNRNQKSSIAAGRKGQCHNVFQGTAKCGYCGSPVHIRRKPGINSGFLYCATSLQGAGCIGSSYNIRYLESEFLSFTRELNIAKLINAPSINSLTTKQTELAACIGELAEVGRKQSNLLSALEIGSQITSIVHRLRDVDARHHELKKLRLALQSEISVLENISDTRQSYLENVETLMTQLNSNDIDLDARLRLRFRLLTEIQQVVKRLDLFPIGALSPSQLDHKSLAEQLAEAGYSPERIKEYIDSLPTKPDRNARFFIAHLRNGMIRTVVNGKMMETLDFETSEKIQEKSIKLMADIKAKKKSNESQT
ncbi:recombinase family protein [Herbaspirillum sp. NPDC087042]|uniref:recombinase family protein n=1 Tax=Herbaspirillum sp. NPDC087042 TaxID=3364004 RepID=UPI0038268699